MNISVGVSNRHIHLSEEDFLFLFPNGVLKSIKDLSQEGDFASNLTLDIKTGKSIIRNVRVVGPFRENTQVEISKTDAYTLGINPPIRMSGNFDEAESVILCNENNELKVNTCIIANRHIHANNIEAQKYGFYEGKKVKIRVDGIRGGILDNVIIKIKDNYHLELHLDTDEANAFLLKNGSVVEIVEE